MTIRIELEAEEERAFLEQARLSGQGPDQYAQSIIRDHLAIGAFAPLPEKRPMIKDLVEAGRRPRRSGDKIPSIEEVRAALAGISCSMAEAIITEREDRF